ncbi:MAG: hypothetical protein AB2541_08045 [Candidatus Thiodiazotropha sp.]
MVDLFPVDQCEGNTVLLKQHFMILQLIQIMGFRQYQLAWPGFTSWRNFSAIDTETWRIQSPYHSRFVVLCRNLPCLLDGLLLDLRH